MRHSAEGNLPEILAISISKICLKITHSKWQLISRGSICWHDLDWWVNIDGLMQERCNSSALAMELRLSCTNPSTWSWPFKKPVVEAELTCPWPSVWPWPWLTWPWPFQCKKLVVEADLTEGYVTDEDEGADMEKSKKGSKRVSDRGDIT